MTEIKDSMKPWAVFHMISNTGQILPLSTRYFWTKFGAVRYARQFSNDTTFRVKVVRN